MIYLDYAATTPIDPLVLEEFGNAEKGFFANANSAHALGRLTHQAIMQASEQIASYVGFKSEEIIYTSSATEANNLAIKGLAWQNPQKKHIITSAFEHSSVVAPLYFLQKQGYEIDFVALDAKGRYNLDQLTNMIRSDTLMVCLMAVDSETGVLQPVEEVGKITRNAGVVFMCDMTQAWGKCLINTQDMDLVSGSAHKIYGPKGIGFLAKRQSITLTPLIHGGKSTTNLRSGTPPAALILALAKALSLAMTQHTSRYQQVEKIKETLLSLIKSNPYVILNHNEFVLPQFINISILNIDPDKWVTLFSDHQIYVSSKTACSGKEKLSKSVLALTHDEQRASTSLRITCSHLTTSQDVHYFNQVLNQLIKEQIIL